MNVIEIDTIRRLKDAEPFRPFVIRLKDGQAFPVRSRSTVQAPPGADSIVLWDPGRHMRVTYLWEIAEAQVVDDVESACDKHGPRIPLPEDLAMRAETVRELQRSTPFRQFRLFMADGRSVLITHPEMMWLPPGDGRMLYASDPEGHTHHIDLFLVTDATVEEPGAASDRDAG